MQINSLLQTTRIRHNFQCSHAHTDSQYEYTHTHTVAARRGSVIREPPCATRLLQMKCNSQLEIRDKRKRQRRRRRRLLQK